MEYDIAKTTMSFTTFSSKPRIIEADIIEVIPRLNINYNATFNPFIVEYPKHPYMISVNARNTLATLNLPEAKIINTEAQVREIKCIDEGDINPFVFKCLYSLDRYNRIDFTDIDIKDFISKYVDYDKKFFPKVKLHIVMRWKETIQSTGHIVLDGEIKCIKMECEDSLDVKDILEQHEKKPLESEIEEEKPKRGRPKKKTT